jgi:preprotein translocase subunit YajC
MGRKVTTMSGAKARVLAAQQLSVELGVPVKAEYVRVRWVEAAEKGKLA